MSDEQQGPTLREHFELREKHAALEAGVINRLNNIESGVSRIETMLIRQPQTQQPQVDHFALAMQRVADQIDKRSSGGSSVNPIVLAIVILVISVGSFLIGKVFF